MTRLLAIGLVLATFLQGAAFAPGQQQASWDGTWVGGWETGHGTQVIFVGNELIGIYWHDDYIGDAHSSATADGATITITWPSAQATLTRAGNDDAHIVIREAGEPDVAFALKRDHS